MIKFKKIDVGHYEIIRNGQAIGEVIKLTEKEWKAWGDHGCYFFKTRSGAADILSRVTPEAAAAAPQPKESTYEEMTAEDHWAAEITGELNKKISEKIQPVFDGPVVSPFRIGCSSGSWELKGSKRLDFMEFMYIYSDGSVISEAHFQTLCEAYAEDDGDCGPDSHADNFADCWGDYLRAWQKANADQLCSCCNGEGSVKGSETKSVIRMITCPECKGDGLQVDEKEMEIQELIQITQDQGVKGEELQEIITWLRSVEQRTVRVYLEAARKDPSFIQPKEQRCDLCGGSGRVADDILCWKCEQPLDVSNPFEDLRDYSEEPEVRYSLQTALMDFKECGETRLTKDPILEQMVILELLEMGINVIKYDLDGVTVIEQDLE